MDNDEEVQRELWRGSIPVEFVLVEHEAATQDTAPSFYRLIPRLSLLPFYLDDIRAHFADHAVNLAGDHDLWVSFRDQPVPWHLPMGVIYDILCACYPADDALPLQLKVQYRSFPDEKLIRLGSQREVAFLFMHSLKQAVTVISGSAKPIITLSTADQTSVCDSVRDCNYDKYAETRKAIVSRFSEGNQTTNSGAPVMIYTVEQGKGPTSLAILLRTTQPGQTFGQFMRAVLPNLFPEQDTTADRPLVGSIVTVLVNGVSPFCSTPMAWLAQNCCNPDMFLHIVVAKSS